MEVTNETQKKVEKQTQEECHESFMKGMAFGEMTQAFAEKMRLKIFVNITMAENKTRAMNKTKKKGKFGGRRITRRKRRPKKRKKTKKRRPKKRRPKKRRPKKRKKTKKQIYRRFKKY